MSLAIKAGDVAPVVDVVLCAGFISERKEGRDGTQGAVDYAKCVEDP